MQAFITAKQSEIVELCRTHDVRSLSIFGSAVRDDFNAETSDVDVRVIFDGEGQREYTENLYDFEDKMQELLGREVHIMSGSEIRNRRLRKIIEDEQVLLYAA
jgi:predicted nucleotidyltransferase